VFNERTSLRSNNKWIRPPALGRSAEHPSAPPAVIILGPPWPRGGAARVIQNQIVYYRNRGFFTVFIAVPFHGDAISRAGNPKEMTEGMDELGSDRLFTAILEQKRYNLAKYKASIRHALRGTVLDWQVAIGRAARLSGKDIDFLGTLPTALFHVNHVYTLDFALNLRRLLFGGRSRLPVILETHDVQSHLLFERGIRNPWTRRPDRLKRLIAAEAALLKKVNVLIHLSVDDFKFFRTLIPGKPQFLALPTIDENFCSNVNASSAQSETIDLLFVGQPNPPNLDAIKWFFDQIWPLINDRGYNLKIVGHIGSLVQKELPRLYDSFGSYFVGPVADLAPYYRAARCVIAPMVSGSGTSIKTIEALALGKPFVGTSKAFRGMPLDQINRAGLREHDNPQAFAEAIAYALCSQDLAGAMSRAAYDDIFSIGASFAARDEALHAAIAAG
jgi:glycosyltransferase involved in cell wall biosynthesis